MASNENSDERAVTITWIVFNALLVLYFIGLTIYGKRYRKKDIELYKSYVEEKGLFYRETSTYNQFNDKLVSSDCDSKSDNLL